MDRANEKTGKGRFWERFAALSVRRPGPFVLAGLVALAATAPFAARLYGDLRTDLRELLPQGAPAAVALQELEKRVGGLSHLSIVVRTKDLAAGERFVDALAARLRELPPSLLARVQARVDEERDFFEAHGALYAETKDLVQVRDLLQTRIAEARRAANPLLVDFAGGTPPPGGGDAEGRGGPLAASEPPPGKLPSQAALEDVIARVKRAFGKLDRFPDGYLAGEGGETLVVLVTPSGAAVSLQDDQALFAAVDGIVRDLRPESFHPSIRVGYEGEVRELIEAQEALVRDLFVSSALVLVAVGAALLAYYRSWRALPLLALPLFTGVSSTFALSRFAIRYLNPNTAFLGSIIVGNGINAGIILLARYLEERRRGRLVEEALRVSLGSTWLATFAASAAAAASYASLGAVSFRGFNQFGFMGTAGMLFCWLATYLLMPPLIAFFERISPSREKLCSGRRAMGWLAGPYASSLTRHAHVAVGVSLVLVAAAGLAGARFLKEPIEYDFRRLASRRGLEDGAAFWEKHVEAVLQSYQTPTVVLTDSPERARAVAAELERERRMQGSGGTIDSVATLQKLVPDDQERKLELLRETFALLSHPGTDGVDARILDALPPELRPTLLRLREKTRLAPVRLEDVPPRLTRLFEEKDGQRGRIVLVYPTLATNAQNGRAQIAHAKVVREAALRADPQALVAGQIVLSSDIVDSITGDGGKAALLSFLGVAVLTFLVMRKRGDSAWVVGSLCLGVLWMFGALGALSLKLNFVNFAVLPITFGIGVDYAVNLYQRYRQSATVGDALATSGGAVALCSVTTIIGYATLLTADNRAIQSFGLTAVLGEFTCLSAALFALPALLSLRDRRRAARELPALPPGVIESEPQKQRGAGASR